MPLTIRHPTTCDECGRVLDKGSDYVFRAGRPICTDCGKGGGDE